MFFHVTQFLHFNIIIYKITKRVRVHSAELKRDDRSVTRKFPNKLSESFILLEIETIVRVKNECY